ncbi:MAG: hypothetical protein HOP10_14715 [Chitinophagaceae bacterium]|nr:hypothetical protein [Chitinophagaceae bacterium]
MKKISLLFLLLALSAISFCQKPTLTKEEYLAKGKSQKKAAWIMLGTGGALLAIAAPGKVSFDILPVLVIGGGGLVIGSIPLFLASGKNKRRAMSMAFKNETVPLLQNGSLSKWSCASISIKIDL